ncbi:ribonuclease HIII [uncultured Megasphaera sp.]|uniref:ribonuclease HIII n=1 Tax=uncultured Megasphaera sp. TaxID=165188 RepID=UPI00265963AD|nr:ribonuclease HIII [uncultured Megasphaera sp.]
MDIRLQQAIERIKHNLTDGGLRCIREKAINYGYQLVCAQGDATATVNIYYGKKGLSVVVQGKDGAVKQKAAALAAGTKAVAASPGKKISSPVQTEEDQIRPDGITAWMGCDESGKGDVFGPLAGAACLLHTDEEQELRSLGVCDSKALTDSVIADLAAQIKKRLGSRCITTVYMPEEYNARYEALKQQKKNLNHLLGGLHGYNIRTLLSKHECPCIIVDKFGKPEYVLNELGNVPASHQVIQVPRGERDTAVAAASILARQAFVDGMAALESRYGMSFPKGAYLGVAAAIRQFRSHFGDAELRGAGKLNFKNFDFLRG